MKKLLLIVFCILCMHHPLSAATMQDSVEIVFTDSVKTPIWGGGEKRSLRKPPKAYLCNGNLHFSQLQSCFSIEIREEDTKAIVCSKLFLPGENMCDVSFLFPGEYTIILYLDGAVYKGMLDMLD